MFTLTIDRLSGDVEEITIRAANLKQAKHLSYWHKRLGCNLVLSDDNGPVAISKFWEKDSRYGWRPWAAIKPEDNIIPFSTRLKPLQASQGGPGAV